LKIPNIGSRRFVARDLLRQIAICAKFMATEQVSPVRRPQPVAVEATGWLFDRYRAGVARASTTFPEDEADFAARIVCCSRRVGLNSLNSLLSGIQTWYK
jgi:hypothetical protein